MIPKSLSLLRAEPWPSSSFRLPRLQAHRGFWKAGHQENTLPAFRAAKAAGFGVSELDVRLSADGIPVVFHDDDLRRLGSGDARSTDDVTADELRQKVSAPTLREVLLDAAVTEAFNVELKCPFRTVGKLEPAVAKVIRECKAEDRVMFSSFNPLSLGVCSHLLPQVPRALLATLAREKGNSLPLRRFWLAPLLRIHILNLDQEMLTDEWTNFLNERGIPFAAWTVNDLSVARELLRKGAASIISDRITPEILGG